MTISNQPHVSIIIPTYNRAVYLPETLDSVSLQTFRQWECIIVDDGSTDETKKIVENYTKADARFRYYERPAGKLKGANACRNFGLSKSSGKFVVFLDSDDLILPDKLQTQIQALESDSQKRACMTQSECFVGSEKTIVRSFGDLEFDKENLLLGLITKKVAWQLAGGVWLKESLGPDPFDESIMGGQDWIFHIKQVIRNGSGSILTLNTTTVLVRLDNESISRSGNDFYYSYQRTKARLAVLELLKKHDHNKESLKAVRAELIKKAIRLLPLSSKRLNPVVNFCNTTKIPFLFFILYTITLSNFYLHKIKLKDLKT